MESVRRGKFLWKWLWGGLLIAMVLMAYIPAMHGGFIWDDESYVTNNSTLRSFDGLRRIWVEQGATKQYYPVVFTSFWIEYQIFGLQPFAYHLVNVLLHALNAVLLWLVLMRLSVPGAWAAAAIFALHPVHVESVAWITERKNVLSGFFYLSALLVYLRISLMNNQPQNDSPSSSRIPLISCSKRRVIGLYLLAIALYCFALLSKSVTCSLPAVILLLLWWKRDSVGLRDVGALMPLFLLGFVFAMNTIWMEKYSVGAQGEEWVFSTVERCLIAGRALWFYAGKLIVPINLTFIYPRWQIDSGIWWQYLFPLAAVALIVLLWSIRRRIGKGPLVAVLIFGGTLVPALGFFDVFPHIYSFIADHFQYLASISLIALWTAVTKTIFRQVRLVGKGIEYGLCAAIILILGVLVWHEGHKYKDLETLWRDTIAKNPKSWMAHNNLGKVLAERGGIAEPIYHYSMALSIKPDYEEAYNNLGVALAAQGKLDEAVDYYSEALSINPYSFSSLNNMGNALKKQGKITEAIRHYFKALRVVPHSAIIRNNLGLALVEQAKLDEAIGQYSEALRIKPHFFEAHSNLGLALTERGDFAEAVRHYSEALRLRPDSFKTHNNLGLALLSRGKPEEAIAHFREALRIRPDYATAHDNLKRVLTGKRRFDAALAKILEELKLNPGNPALHYRLGNLYQRTGRLNDAIDQYEKALSIQPKFVKALHGLAMAYKVKKEYDRAISLFRKMIELRPDIAGAYYNIACIYARQNRIEESTDWLKKAIEKGYNNWDLLKTDKDLENIQGSLYYKALIQGH